ncbi:low affinity zinc transporter [Scheffersomyces stipitis CBS 6054]|uniref:Low affinity zinc transporter n=1 Tax=Scheffersomyces stipitis (strain ATCC 58785 / CBS 6054 / NBRC 10063 / NRRL Y-11545) TaxID=322104 RepID=A3LU47_PICST|nr:low affinity zinc transporter [Scheffersomyces stipitis CBS 6054]ABN66523.1 low affinity zinc transporter [Scheffersomyces stipitis CBS 6054]
MEDTCPTDNEFNGQHMKARIASVFVIMIVSGIGSFLPLISSKCPSLNVPPTVFFIIRYVGTGVILATAFIHLLAEGIESLTNECLGGIFEDYSWGAGIALIGVWGMFLFDLVARRIIRNRNSNASIDSIGCCTHVALCPNSENVANTLSKGNNSLTREIDIQILNVFILEIGIVFHSVFVGLALAIAGDDFIGLFIAISFHQLLEGLGLGARFAMAKWPKGKEHYPWLLSTAFTLVTPISIAVGLGVRKSYPPGSRIALITNGIFDSLCSGVLIYNSLVELMAYDFMYSQEFEEDEYISRQLWAFLCLSIGAFAMALLGYWA